MNDGKAVAAGRLSRASRSSSPGGVVAVPNSQQLAGEAVDELRAHRAAGEQPGESVEASFVSIAILP